MKKNHATLAARKRDIVITAKGLTKTYVVGGETVRALQNATFEIERGTFTAILGPSGSGKSTLMNILGCLDTPTAGEYILDNISVSSMSLDDLAAVRNKNIGFIFQSFNLLSRYNLFHNVELPLIYSGMDAKERKKHVVRAIQRVGLSSRMKHRPNELSGGQRQRVAIARALVNGPSLVLADEPTGNLDSVTGKEILSMFEQLVDEGNTIVMVTHDMNIAKNAPHRITIADGEIKDIV